MNDDRQERLRQRHWGIWYIVKSRRVFGTKANQPDSMPYEIDLDDLCRRPVELFFHISQKRWAKGHVEELLEAFDDLFDGRTWAFIGHANLNGVLTRL